MTAPLAKFTFDTEFRSEGDVISNAARARQKKSYTQDEIDAMCARAREEGTKAGAVRAQEAIAVALRDTTATLQAVMGQARAEIDAVRAESAQIALAAAAKLARAAIEVAPHEEVERALREALHQAIGEPRVVIKAAPAVITALQPKIEEIAADEGYDGRIVLTPDPRAPGADCRIEWRGAGAEHSQDRIEAALADLITRRFSQISPKG
jgi:flagellar assembly protein FliH